MELLDLETFNRLAVPCSYWKEANEALRKARENGEFEKIRNERFLTWSLLANQVIGHEDPSIFKRKLK